MSIQPRVTSEVQVMRNELNEYLRAQFPALKNEFKGQPIAYLDGPGGYQIPERVFRAIEDYLINMNANVQGAFITSKRNDEMIKNSRYAFADFFNCSWDEVVFGANMTTLNFALSQALMREMEAGDKVLITELDHEGNRGPWEALQDRGIIIEEIEVDVSTCTLDMNNYKLKLTPNTKVVAVTAASNAVGTITDIDRIVAMAKEIGAYTVVDAVHYAAHKPIDVQKIGTDFLICSVYKSFGPHIGVMYVKKEVLNKLRPLKVRPQYNYPPYMFETGTLNHEGIAGAAEAVEFVADIGAKFGNDFQSEKEDLKNRRNRIVAGLQAIASYEEELTTFLINELCNNCEVKIFGPPLRHPRTSTVSFTYKGYTANQLAGYLGDRGLFVWAGDFYATKLVERLGLRDMGGLIRIGIAPYNTKDELERLIKAVKDKKSLESFLERGDSESKNEQVHLQN